MSVKNGRLDVLVPLESWEDAVTEAQELEVKLAEANARADRAERDRRHMHDTLTHAQRRSTECLEIARAVKAIGDDDVMQQLAPLGACIKRADEALASSAHLFETVQCVMRAYAQPIGSDRRTERIKESLLDLAACAMRIVLGDGA